MATQPKKPVATKKPAAKRTVTPKKVTAKKVTAKKVVQKPKAVSLRFPLHEGRWTSENGELLHFVRTTDPTKIAGLPVLCMPAGSQNGDPASVGVKNVAESRKPVLCMFCARMIANALPTLSPADRKRALSRVTLPKRKDGQKWDTRGFDIPVAKR